MHICDTIEKVIDFNFSYPHQFESSFAAYLTPSDLQAYETFLVSDLIEDVVSGNWNQGDCYRLKESEAIWDGKEFY
ncbi:hypothetical protein A0256_03365 [Mucilaginibacter sp. PAMC 26640]|nr:hypothetical protein A0256_03365 [Mucilaginibacter sp. PAMC 26640]